MHAKRESCLVSVWKPSLSRASEAALLSAREKTTNATASWGSQEIAKLRERDTLIRRRLANLVAVLFNSYV